MKIFRNEDGQTLVLTALCMTAMLGFMALAIDVGLLFRAKRNMQITADAVAVAAALDFYYGNATNTNALIPCASSGTSGCHGERNHQRNQRHDSCELPSKQRSQFRRQRLQRLFRSACVAAECDVVYADVWDLFDKCVCASGCGHSSDE